MMPAGKLIRCCGVVILALATASLIVRPAWGDELGDEPAWELDDDADDTGAAPETPDGSDESVIVPDDGAGGESGESPMRPSRTAGRPDPCAASHKGLFYENDFSYLTASNYGGYCLGDCWKLMPAPGCAGCGTLDVGGQLRLRYHHELGMGQDVAGPGALRFQDTVHDFLLTRLRLYTNWKLSDDVRFYAEGILADTTDDDGTYQPRPIDRNFGDFLNLFVDLALTDCVTVRVGRQELLYGAQRVVSPLDWANTRRTFEGVRLLAEEGDWAVDAFFTHLVPVVPNQLDEADYKQPFYGTYAVYSGWEQDTLELYYLGYDNRHPGTVTSDFSLHTFGTRLFGSRGDWLYETEGGVQVGRQSGLGQDHSAGFATAGLGYKFSDHPWTPIVWFYYDYASGDSGGEDFNRFNQLFPLAHKYFGFIDAVQRSNIESPNVLLTMKPHERVEILLWYWHFMSNTAADIVPSIGGTPPQSTASKDLGDELDFYVKYAFGPRSNILFGWSHFWGGNKILAPQDADFFYTQWELNF